MADFAVNFVATGGAQVEQQLQAILRGSTATSAEITRLSRSLKTSGEGAAAFATNLGLSVKETANAVTKFRQLEKAGFDNASAFQLMQKETGITAEQFGKLTEGLSSAQVQLDKYKESQQGSAKASAAQVLALQQVNQAAANLASSLGSIVSQATEEFIAYDDALTSVAAKSGVAKDALGFLEEATQRVALTTSQSPTSALKAADSLIALGASAQEAADRVGSVAQLTDALRTVGADIETSAKVVQLGTSIFAKFGETAETVGDKLVTISDSSAVASSEGLNEFLQVLSKAGGFAAQLGVGLDELLASFATLRDAGQAPEVAATSLRGLLSTALESRNELENLGITVFEVGQNGQESFVGLERLFAQIGQKSVDTTDLLDLFGKQGVASAVALSENYGKVSTQVDNLSNSFGNLQRKSNTINSSIQGQITLLQGSLQTALVEIGRTTGQFTAPLVGLVTDLVNAFISASPVIKNFVGGLVGISAVLATAVAGATSYALALKALETAQVGLTLKTAASTIGIQAKTASLKLAALAGNAEAKAALASASASGVQAGALQGVSAAAGTTAASLGLIIVALGSIALAAKAYQVITAESGQTREATNELSDAIDQYEAGLGKVITTQDGWLESFQGVVNRIRDAVAEFPLLAGAVDRYTQSLRQAQVNQNSIAFGELQQQLNRTSQAFADLKTSNDLSGDAAADLLPILKQQLATLQAFQPATESEITVRGAAIKQTREQINAIQGAIDAQQKQSEQSKNDIKIAEERATELKAKEEEIALESTRIEQEKNQEIERLAKEKIAELERIEKERIETEKALRQAAYDEEVRQIEALKNAAERAANDRINAQNAILESLDDQSTAISNQQSLLELQLSTQQTISDARIARLDEEIAALGNASGLIDAINSKELDKEELLTAQNELRRLGLDAQSSESEILDVIKQKTIEKSDAEKKALEDRQEGERALLALSQDQERIELQRSLTQARIAEIEAQSLVVQASINAKGEERLLNYYKIQVAAAKAAGASDAELIALEGQVLAQADALALAESQIPLAQTAADLAGQQVDDAERAVAAGEELFKAQNKNLDAAQAAELAAFNAAENTERVNDALGGAAGGANATADGLERAASAASKTADALANAKASLASLESQEDRAINKALASAKERIKKLEDEKGRSLTQSEKELILSQEQRPLKGTGTRSTPGLGTQYFVDGKEVSPKEYAANKSRESFAGKSTTTISSNVPFNPADDSYVELKKTIEGLQTLLLVSSKSGFKATENSLVGRQIKLLSAQLTNFFTDYKKESEQLTDEQLASEAAKIEAARIEAQKKNSLYYTRQTQLELEEFNRKWDILTRINNDRLAEKRRQESAAARAAANEEAAIRREIQDIQQKQLTADQIAAEKDLLEFRINNERNLSEFQLENLRQRIAALKEVEAINDRIAKQQQLEEGVLLANLPGRALGGPVAANQPYLVGERGVEVFVPDSSGRIIPNDQLSIRPASTAQIGASSRKALEIEQAITETIASRREFMQSLDTLQLTAVEQSRVVLDLSAESNAQLREQYEQEQDRIRANKERLALEQAAERQRLQDYGAQLDLAARAKRESELAKQAELERLRIEFNAPVEEIRRTWNEAIDIYNDSIGELQRAYARQEITEEDFSKKRLDIQLELLDEQTKIRQRELDLYSQGGDRYDEILVELEQFEIDRLDLIRKYRIDELSEVLEDSNRLVENSTAQLNLQRQLGLLAEEDYNNRVKQLASDRLLTQIDVQKKILETLKEGTDDYVDNQTKLLNLQSQLFADSDLSKLSVNDLLKVSSNALTASEQQRIARDLQNIQSATKNLEIRLDSDKISDALKESDKERTAAFVDAIKEGIAKLLFDIPGRATGGPVLANRPYIVGERRPELFVPRVPGTIVPRVPQASGSGSLARVEALLTQLVARPLPVVNAPATFINQPNPLQTQIELLQGQMRAARSAI